MKTLNTARLARTLALTLACSSLATPAVAFAGARVSIELGLPAVLPPMVVVEPGVQVVQDYGEEIFFVDGYYWVRRDGAWYRARHHRDRWTYVEPRHLAPALVHIPPGRYRRWHGGERRAARGEWRGEHRAPERARQGG